MRVVPGVYTTTRWGIQGSIDIRNVPADTYFRGMKRINLQGHGRSVLAAMETIEVVKGPPPPIYGMGKIGGYTNMVPKSMRAANGGYLSAPQGFAQAISGSYERSEMSFGVGGPLPLEHEQGGYYVYGLFEDSGTFIEQVPVGQRVLQGAVSIDDVIGKFRLEAGVNLQRSRTAGALIGRFTQDVADRGRYVRGTPLVDLDANGQRANRLSRDVRGLARAGAHHVRQPGAAPILRVADEPGRHAAAARRRAGGAGHSGVAVRLSAAAPGSGSDGPVARSGARRPGADLGLCARGLRARPADRRFRRARSAPARSVRAGAASGFRDGLLRSRERRRSELHDQEPAVRRQHGSVQDLRAAVQPAAGRLRRRGQAHDEPAPRARAARRRREQSRVGERAAHFGEGSLRERRLRHASRRCDGRGRGREPAVCDRAPESRSRRRRHAVVEPLRDRVVGARRRRAVRHHAARQHERDRRRARRSFARDERRLRGHARSRGRHGRGAGRVSDRRRTRERPRFRRLVERERDAPVAERLAAVLHDRAKRASRSTRTTTNTTTA